MAVTGLSQTPWLIVMPLFGAVTTIGFLLGNGAALAMEQTRDAAGSGSAVLGAFTFLAGALVSPLGGVLGDDSAVPMGSSCLPPPSWRWRASELRGTSSLSLRDRSPPLLRRTFQQSHSRVGAAIDSEGWSGHQAASSEDKYRPAYATAMGMARAPAQQTAADHPGRPGRSAEESCNPLRDARGRTDGDRSEPAAGEPRLERIGLHAHWKEVLRESRRPIVRTVRWRNRPGVKKRRLRGPPAYSRGGIVAHAIRRMVQEHGVSSDLGVTATTTGWAPRGGPAVDARGRRRGRPR